MIINGTRYESVHDGMQALCCMPENDYVEVSFQGVIYEGGAVEVSEELLDDYGFDALIGGHHAAIHL